MKTIIKNIKNRDYSRAVKVGGILVSAAVIFFAGMGVGNGHISLSHNNLKVVNKSTPNDLNYSSVEQTYDLLRSRYDGQLDETKLLDGLKKGLVNAAGDPYTEYMDAQAAKDFTNYLNGTLFSGIGAELSKKDDSIVVVSPIAGSPAEKAGLKSGDVITQINTDTTSGMSVDQAVTKIRGTKGTSVKLQIIRAGTQSLSFDIVRDDITIPSVKSEILNGGIGYLQISRFGSDTSGLAKKAAEDFKAKSVKGVILDLRGNGGGLVSAAVDVSSLWLDRQTVLTERRDGQIQKTYIAKGTPVLSGIPTVVLIDGGSASASEITAGALHDNKFATLIGTKSFGKGSEQQVEDLGDGSILKVTVARWYTPNGRNIDKQGIDPDTKVEFSDEDAKAGKDPQKDAAIQFLNK